MTQYDTTTDDDGRAEQYWTNIISGHEGKSVGQLTDHLAEDESISADEAYERIEEAINGGYLVEDTGGSFGRLYPVENGNDDLTARAHAAFADAIEWYHQQLDTELPVDYAETARDYYENVRGWTAETVESKRLGYAPANSRDELLAYLSDSGHDRDAIQACGLFYDDDLYPHFNGRFVLPYFGEAGDTVYAISRSLDADNSGHPGDHHGDQKYTKAIKGKDYTELDEPIYGTETVTDDVDRLLVAGGIADAISLHEAGYACISPVTTVRFKTAHEQQVVDLVDEHDIDGVYLVNDAEWPSVDKKELDGGESVGQIRDGLTIKQFGEGLRGAFGNVQYLIEKGIDPYLVTLPAGNKNLDKVDPDDYLHDNWGDVETVLSAADHATNHDGYQQWTSNRKQREINSAVNTDVPETGDCTSSALFDLTFTDVVSLSAGDRDDNPLGHHGDSHGYYVVIEKGNDTVGYDHKYDVAYNALTYLLCDAGRRRDDSPNGQLNDKEIWVAWKQAKKLGCIPDDDPIPHRALTHIAREADLVEAGEIEDGWKLPVEAYNGALKTVEEAYGVTPGRDPLWEGENSEHHKIESCNPPVIERQSPNVDDTRDRLAGQRYDEYIGADGPVIWGHDPGVGKTTTAGIAAAERDRSHAILFADHEKAREYQLDDATPDDYLHLKGSEQFEYDVCMDADHADEECPDHPGGGCPHLCGVYDLPDDHETRQLYEWVKTEMEPMKAHLLLSDRLSGTPGHNADGECAWMDLLDQAQEADQIVGVHEYQLLNTVREKNDVIIDEYPAADSVASERQLTVESLTRMANAMDDLAAVTGNSLLGEMASWAREIIECITSSGESSIAELSPPDVAEHAETVRESVGLPEEGRYREHTLTAEALAWAKIDYHEGLLSRIQSDELEWNRAPMAMDALIAAAVEAGFDAEDGRRAIAVPKLLDNCPRCGGDLAESNGERVCDGECGWAEGDISLTQKDVQQRAVAWFSTDTDGVARGLKIRTLPHQTDLPTTPLVLDATPNPTDVGLLYGRDADEIPVVGDEPIAAETLTTTQITNGQYHYGTIEQTESLRERLEDAMTAIAQRHDDVLVIGRKAARFELSIPDNVEWLSYHAARGKNRDDCDAVVCLGAPHPDVADIERTAELLAQNSDVRVGGEEYSTRRESQPPVYRKLDYRDDEGTGRAVPTKAYSGLVGEMFRQTREQEIKQSIHRIRPLLANDVKNAYLLTNVPTNLAIDNVCDLAELANPVRALLPVSEQAVELAEHIAAVAQGDGPAGWRANSLVRRNDSGEIEYRISHIHELAKAHGLAVSERTVRRWVSDLESVGILDAGDYKPRDGVPYHTDEATLTKALSVVASNARVDVDVQRRIRQLMEEAESSLGWLSEARDLLGLSGDHCGLVDVESPPGKSG